MREPMNDHRCSIERVNEYERQIGSNGDLIKTATDKKTEGGGITGRRLEHNHISRARYFVRSVVLRELAE